MPNEPQDADQRTARAIAFAIRKLNRCMPAEARWLAEYEAKHGKVETEGGHDVS